jgi:predicted Zn-dependent protease
MTDVTTALPGRPTASVSKFVATFAALMAMIGVLLGLDTALARIDRRESTLHAATLYAQGVALLDSGRAREASDRFSSAVAMERGTERYAVALAEALLADGHNAEAEETVQSVLNHAGMDGAANVTMARALSREGKAEEAVSYYHRAVYGRWGPDSTEQRTRIRLELIDLQARRNDLTGMLAELLPLDALSADTGVRRRVGHLFIQAGSPRRGAAVLRELLHKDPNDADAQAGLGEAALALGNFATARADFAEASRLQPDTASFAHRLLLADTVLAMDPSARGLDTPARYGRSKSLLARTLQRVDSCGGAPRSSGSADSARVWLAGRALRGQEEGAADAMLLLAASLWSARPASCVQREGDEALALVLGQVGQ